MKTAFTVACLNMDYQISMFDLHKYKYYSEATQRNIKRAEIKKDSSHLFLQLDVLLIGDLGILVPLPKIL